MNHKETRAYSIQKRKGFPLSKYFTFLSMTMILCFVRFSDYSMYHHFNYKKSVSSPQFHFFLEFSEWRLIIFLQKLTTNIYNRETICFL